MQDETGNRRSGAFADTLGVIERGEETRIPNQSEQIPVGLTAAVIALQDDEPVALVVRSASPGEQGAAQLPSLSYRPRHHGALDEAVRQQVLRQTGVNVGHVEQLSTAFELEHDERRVTASSPRLTIGYLALVRAQNGATPSGSLWQSCYSFMPWEDWRQGKPEILTSHLLPRLEAWARDDSGMRDPNDIALSRADRLRVAFGANGGRWDDERVLERLDILEEADVPLIPGSSGLRLDHARVLATGLGRLRSKVKSRPVVFELLPAEFTLFELQRTVEAILGPHLHKQNFRRLVESMGLVEPTGDVRARTGGRPARLFRFRREVMLERPTTGVSVRAGKAA